jgi:peptidoglycan/LPS O-acetylase OafA/YrhL
VLSLAPLAWVGRNLSHGMYLWHYPLARLVADLGVDAERLPVTAVATLAAATVSYHLIERPLLRRGRTRVVAAPTPAIASAR